MGPHLRLLVARPQPSCSTRCNGHLSAMNQKVHQMREWGVRKNDVVVLFTAALFFQKFRWICRCMSDQRVITEELARPIAMHREIYGSDNTRRAGGLWFIHPFDTTSDTLHLLCILASDHQYVNEDNRAQDSSCLAFVGPNSRWRIPRLASTLLSPDCH
jgi:hypothetical protein